MSYRLARRALGVSALALMLGAASALPATAAPTATAALSAEMLDAMQRDLGLTAAQATERVAKEAAAVRTDQTLQTDLGSSFAGSWIDAAGTLVVGTTDPAAAGAIRAAGAQPVVTSRTEADLKTVQSKLDKAAQTAAPSVSSWYVDTATNAVVVTTTDAAAASDFVAKAGAAGEAVRVQVESETVRPLENLVGGQAIYAQNGGRCSVGFTARSATASYVITAGHCTEIGGTWSGYNRVAIGPVAATAFPGDDFGAIRVNSTATWAPTSQVQGTSSVLGSTVAAIGASVCRSGSTTGYRCGTIQARNATVNYGGGDIVNGLTRTSACAEPGDSGGSFVSGRQAQGMTSGGSGNCSVGGTTFFQPVNEALSRYGLTLVVG